MPALPPGERWQAPRSDPEHGQQAVTEPMVCWKCGASLADTVLPFSRAEECRACRAQLHVCRMCRFFDVRRTRGCLEPIAEEVNDRERANFCGYFQPRSGAWQPAGAAASESRAALEALFGRKP